jgi:hypothetical protein
MREEVYVLGKIVMTMGLLAALALVPAVSQAQNPHFTACVATTASGLLSVIGRVAGLGNQIRSNTALHLTATATAVCLDPTTTPPTVVDFTVVEDAVTYPPKNGNRAFVFVVDEPFVLPCDPPSEVTFVGAAVCDTTHGICTACPLPPEPEPEPEP